MVETKNLSRSFAGVYSCLSLINVFCCIFILRKKSRENLTRTRFQVVLVAVADIVSTVKDIPAFVSPKGCEQKNSIGLIYITGKRVHLLFLVITFTILLNLLCNYLEGRNGVCFIRKKVTLVVDLIIALTTGCCLVYCWDKYGTLRIIGECRLLPFFDGPNATRTHGWPQFAIYFFVAVLCFVYIFSFCRLRTKKSVVGESTKLSEVNRMMAMTIIMFLSLYSLVLIFEVAVLRGLLRVSVLMTVLVPSLSLFLFSMLPAAFVASEYLAGKSALPKDLTFSKA